MVAALNNLVVLIEYQALAYLPATQPTLSIGRSLRAYCVQCLSTKRLFASVAVQLRRSARLHDLLGITLLIVTVTVKKFV